MPNTQITISNIDKFLENIGSGKDGFSVSEKNILYKSSPDGAEEKIAVFNDDVITADLSSEKKQAVFDRMLEVGKAEIEKNPEDPDKLVTKAFFDEKQKDYFHDIFNGPNAQYALNDKKISSKLSGKEICEYSDGKFVLTKPDDESLKALVDMLDAGGVKRVTVLPADSPVGQRLTKMFLEKGIDVNNVSPEIKESLRPDPRRSLPERSRGTWDSDAPTLSGARHDVDDQSSKTFDEAMKDLRERESGYHKKKGRDFNSKFQLYDDPNDIRDNAPLKMYRAARVGRSYTGKEANGIASAMVNDYFRRRRLERGAAFEVDRNTLRITPLSESRSAIKGMIKFASAARTDQNKKLKFTASSEKAAKRFAQEAIKQGIPLDQLQIDIKDANGHTIKSDYKLSLTSETITRDYMRMRTTTTGEKGNRSYRNDGKYGEQLNDLNIKPFFRKESPDLIKAGQLKGTDGVVRSRFDPSSTINNPHSVMNSPASATLASKFQAPSASIPTTNAASPVLNKKASTLTLSSGR